MNVDIDRLRRVGSQVRTPLVSVDQAINQQILHLTVSGPVAGWGFAPVLDGAAGHWREYLRDLGLRVRKFGDDLVASADDFENADRSSAQSVKSAVAPSYNFPVG